MSTPRSDRNNLYPITALIINTLGKEKAKVKVKERDTPFTSRNISTKDILRAVINAAGEVTQRMSARPIANRYAQI